MLDILHERVSGISDSIALIASEGFIPNKKKHNILYWSSILIHAYENIDVLSKEQQDKLDSLYNKILRA
jgi:hypothetical protein